MGIYSLNPSNYPIFVLTGATLQFSTDNKDCMKRIFLILLTLCLGVATEGKAQNRLYPPSFNDIKYLSWNKNNGKIRNFAFQILPDIQYELKSYTCYYDDSDSVLVLEIYKDIVSNSLFGKIKRLFGGRVKLKAQIEKYRCPISPEATRCFRELFLSAINSSSYLADPLGNDGDDYRFYAERFGSIGSIIMAEGWSPSSPDSNCGILVDILYRISDAVKNNSPEELENLIPIAEDLTLKFKSLYPEDFK